MGVTHPFELYFKRHGHYPRLRIDNGAQRMTVEFAPGYVHIRTSSPFSGSVYITRSAWFTLLKRVVPLSRKWTRHPDFDVPAAQQANYVQEMEHLDALRVQKRARKRMSAADPDEADRRARQRQRHLRARARAAQRAIEDET